MTRTIGTLLLAVLCAGCAPTRAQLLERACRAGIQGHVPGTLQTTWQLAGDLIDGTPHAATPPRTPTDPGAALAWALTLRASADPGVLRLLMLPATHERTELSTFDDVTTGDQMTVSGPLPHSDARAAVPHLDVPQTPGHWTMTTTAPCGHHTLDITLTPPTAGTWQLTLRQAWTLTGTNPARGVTVREWRGPWSDLRERAAPH